MRKAARNQFFSEGAHRFGCAPLPYLPRRAVRCGQRGEVTQARFRACRFGGCKENRDCPNVQRFHRDIPAHAAIQRSPSNCALAAPGSVYGAFDLRIQRYRLDKRTVSVIPANAAAGSFHHRCLRREEATIQGADAAGSCDHGQYVAHTPRLPAAVHKRSRVGEI